MAGVIIDISTGEIIERLGSNKNGEGSSKKEKTIMEILAPDGRKVFSIGRVSRESNDWKEQENVAA